MDWPGTCYVVQAGLELWAVLALPLECWDSRCNPPYLVPLKYSNHTTSTGVFIRFRAKNLSFTLLLSYDLNLFQ